MYVLYTGRRVPLQIYKIITDSSRQLISKTLPSVAEANRWRHATTAADHRNVSSRAAPVSDVGSTLWAIKTRHVYFVITLANIDRFSYFFTAIFNKELQNKNVLKFSPHLKSVTALPCESWMFNSETLQHVVQCKCDYIIYISKCVRKS